MATAYNAKRSSSSEMEGFFKTRYGNIQKLVPSMFTLQRIMPFNEAERIGDKYAEVALLQGEHGMTYAGAGDDAFALVASVPGQTKPTEVQGCQHVLKTRVGINAINSAKKRGETAFEGTMDMVVENANQSFRKRLEIDMFYGQKELAVVDSVSSNTATIAAADWCPGIWAGSEGAVCSAHTASWAASRAGDGVVSSVDIANRQVTFTTIPTSTAATDLLNFKGQVTAGTAPAWVTQKGLHSCLAEASTLFNIDVTYSLWKPCSYAVGSVPITFSKVQKAIYQVQSKGYKGPMRLILNPTTWADLLDDEVALRRHNEGGVRQYEVGAEGIKFYTACGVVTIEASLYCKEGHAFLLPEKGKGWSWRRIGASDVGFDTIKGTSQIERVADVAAYEFRLYDNEAIYTGRPGYSCLLTGIVNNT